MIGIVIVFHVIACVGLIFFILIQSGKGGGLIESFSSAESIFGTKTNTLLAKITTTLAITFFMTCLLLAFFSVQQSKSIVEQKAKRQTKPIATKETKEQKETKTQESAKTEATQESIPQPKEEKITETKPQENAAQQENAAKN
jgi:preprotein translocase subunit SecG